jgi:iron complex outermembrane recepter protein
MSKPQTRYASRIGHLSRIFAAILTVWLACAPVDAAEPNPPIKKYEIAAGDAATTLKQFVEQSGEQVVFFINKVRGITTTEVHGDFMARGALDRMLAGTPLYAVQDERTHALIINRTDPVSGSRSRDSRALATRKGDAPRRSTDMPSNSPTTAAAQPSDTVQRMPEFTITSERDSTYVGRQSLSTTRTGVELVDLPQSVVVLNKAFINDVNPTILAKALVYVGGAQTGTINWSVDRYMIRGFVGEGDYVDGFRTQTDKNTNFNLIDHVEVIKGPAAIFIANQAQTVGGVINKISKSPTDYRLANLTLQTGLWDGNRADLDVSGPLSPNGKLMGRLLVTAQDSDGYYDFTYEKRISILPMVGYRWSASTEGWIKFETFNSHYSAYNGLPLDARTNQVIDVPRTRNLNEDRPNNWRTDRFNRLWAQFTTRPTSFLGIRVAALDSTDTQRRVEAVVVPSGALVPTMGADGIARFLPYPQYAVPPTYTAGTLLPRAVTAIDGDHQPRRELQNDYVFSFDAVGASHTFLFGGNLIDFPQSTRTYSSGPQSTAFASGIDPFNPTYPGTVSVDFNQPPVDQTERSQKFAKLYALETVSWLNRRLILSFGGSRNRYAMASHSLEYNQLTRVASVGNVVPRTVLHKNLVQYGVVVKPWTNVSVFYGYNRNFSSNGVQFGAFLPPQEGAQKEIGVKSEWWDNRITLGVNHFEVVQLNNAVPAYPQTTPPSNVLVPGTVSRGFDGDFSAALAKNLDVIGSFAWFRAHVPLPAPYNFALQPYDNRVHSSIPVNNVSQHNLAAWVRYKFTSSPVKGLAVGLGMSYLDKRAITDNTNSVFYGYLPARALADAMVSYETKRMHFQLNIDNVLGRRYIYAARSNQVLVPGSPTNLRLAVTYKL